VDRKFTFTKREMVDAPKDGSRVLVFDGENWYVVAWLDDYDNYSYSRHVMCWCVPESFQDEQGGYVVIDKPLFWVEIK
jgi:hypothetical protein